MKIAIGSDHAGFSLKVILKNYLEEKGIQVNDFGTFTEESVDYPDFAHPVAESVEKKEVDFGIIMCGTGNGINIAANKHKGIRAALCWNSDIAILSRQHNDANILTLPARFISKEDAIKCVESFINTLFEGGRHSGRVKKISDF